MFSEKYPERRKGKRAKPVRNIINSNQAIETLLKFFYETKIAEGPAFKPIDTYRFI